jgi:ATP-binding cassette subfamily B protein
VVFCMIGLIWACLNTFIPYILKLLIDTAVNFKGPLQEVFLEIKPYIIIYSLSWLFLCLNMRFLEFIKLKTFPNIRYDILTSQFSYLTQHQYQYFQNHFAGNLANKIMDLQAGIINILSIIDECAAQICGLMIAFITLTLVHPIFASILMCWVIVFVSIAFFFLNPIQNLSLIFAEARSSLMGKIVDSISNIMNMRLFARNQYEHLIMSHATKDCIEKDRKMLKKIVKMRLIGDFSILLFLGGNLWMLGYLYSKGKVSIGDFSFILTLSISIMWNLWYLTGQFVIFSEESGRCEQALTIIDKPIGIKDTDDAKPLKINKASIEFKDVSFHYNQGKSLFKNKNILIPSGQKVGLVGFSGSGKSTLVNLILRLFDVESGEILIDSQNIKHVTQQSLSENIGFIPQDTSLFHRSIMDNIRYGNIHASDEEVIHAAKLAHADEFIQQLPDGYQSLVGERGIKLSGGQRQRIAIARAMLKNAPILILDEATSALDSQTEQYIQQSLNILMQHKTTIVIAHRLSTLIQMDRILVLDKGRIIEDGTHNALLQHNGHYAKLWAMQAGGFIGQIEK